MIVSTRGRYALRVMVDLAENGGKGYTAMKEIAERQDISLKYLEKILPPLVSEKLIEGVHGKGGGYRLTRRPEEYPVGEILRLTEGEDAFACAVCGAGECDRRGSCRTRPLWDEASEVLKSYFDGKTIADLMKK